MSIRIAYSIILIFITFSATGYERLFPVADNGKWGLVSDEGNFIVRPFYDYIEYNVHGQKYIYHLQGKVGLIDNEGKVISKPIYDQVQFLSADWFSFRKDDKWTLMTGDRVVLDENFDSITVISNSTFGLIKDERMQIFDGNTEMRTEKWYKRGEKKGAYVLAWSNQKIDLLEIVGLKPVAEQIVQFDKLTTSLRKVVFENGQRILDTSRHEFVTKLYDEIIQRSYVYFLCKGSDGASFYSSKENKNYQVPEIDDVLSFKYPNATVLKGSKTGVWNVANNSWVLDPIYDAISRDGGKYFVRKNGGYGVLSNSGKALVPSKYSDIEDFGNVYRVRQGNLFGLVNRAGKEIEPCQYLTLRIYDDKVKCFTEDQLITIKLSENGSVEEKMVYDEFMTLGLAKERMPARKVKDIKFDGIDREMNRSLYEGLGWFQREYRREQGDSIVTIKGKWGLRWDTDSVAITPRFKDLRIERKSKFTAAYKEKRLVFKNQGEYKQAIKRGHYFFIAKSKGYNDGFFQIVDHETKTLLSTTEYQYVNFKDLEEQALARAITDKPVLIDQMGEVVYDKITYVEKYHDGVMTICQGGAPEVLGPSKTFESHDIWQYLTRLELFNIQVDRIYPRFKINGGSWFFVDESGNKLNEEPFEFARPMKHNRAIVKKNGKWGVVDSTMNEIVPIEYISVRELKIDTTTYYHVKNRSNRTFMYTRSSGQLEETNVEVLLHYLNGHWFGQDKATHKWALIDTSLKPITGFEFDYIFPFQNGYAPTRTEGKMSVIDENGSAYFGYFKAKKIIPLEHERFAVIQKRGRMMLDLSGDTLIGRPDFKEYVAGTERFIVYRDLARRIKIKDMEGILKLPKKANIRSFSLSAGLVHVYLGNKHKLFSLNTNKFLRIKLDRINQVGHNCYSFKDRRQNSGVLSLEGDTLIQPVYKSINIINKNLIIAKNKKKRITLYNGKGNKTFENLFMRIVDKGAHYILYGKNGVGLLNKDGKLLIPCKFREINLYNGIYYKAVKKNGENHLFDLEGNKILGGNFSNIKGVNKEGLIVRAGGFEYLYTGFVNKTLSFQNIFPISSNTFLFNETRVEGLYSEKGENILPLEYHRIVNDRGYLQVRFFNSFGYFNQEGKPLFDPKSGK